MKLLCALLALAAGGALAQGGESPGGGSSAFCLFPLAPENGVQRSINLAIVQYVDTRADEVRIYFGGGNLGSGHEARIAVRNRDEAEALLARLRRAAAACSRPTNPSGAAP